MRPCGVDPEWMLPIDLQARLEVMHMGWENKDDWELFYVMNPDIVPSWMCTKCKRLGPEACTADKTRYMVVRHYGEEKECSICYDNMLGKTVGIGPCGHAFHARCMTKWRNGRVYGVTCPLCRTDFSDGTRRLRR